VKAIAAVDGLDGHLEPGEDRLDGMDDLGDLVVRPARVVVDGLRDGGAGLNGVGAAQQEGEAAKRRPAANLQLVEPLAQDLVGIVDHHGLRVIQGGDPALAVRM